MKIMPTLYSIYCKLGDFIVSLKGKDLYGHLVSMQVVPESILAQDYSDRTQS